MGSKCCYSASYNRFMKVPWTTKRSNQSILKKINPEYSLEGLMLKLKLQSFGYLVRRKSKSESEVAQSFLTLCDPMDCSLPCSSVHGIFQARILEWVALSFSRVFSTQGLNLGLLHCRQILYYLSHQINKCGINI